MLIFLQHHNIYRLMVTLLSPHHKGELYDRTIH